MMIGRTADVVTPDELTRRVIEPADFIADRSAFVDVRLPGSEGKASYSIIGSGVSQNAGQTINLTEPHGFNIGAASMPHGRVNNQHLHFTAEVFVCTRGNWRMFIGEDRSQSVDIGVGTIFSVPTWLFRGFENLGDDDGWLFTVLGGDDTGGILWAPSVLRDAADTGLHIGTDYSLRDAHAGDPLDDVVEPLTSEQLAWTRAVTDDEIEACIVERNALRWSGRSLLSTVLDGHDASLAPVIGHGMTEDRDQAPPLTVPHGFSVEWLQVAPGSSVGLHRHDDSQVLLLVEGEWEVTVNRAPDACSARPATGSVVSMPQGAWRDFANVGSLAAFAVVVNGGEGPTHLKWADEIRSAARDSGWSIDASGYLAPAALVDREQS